MKVLIGFGLIPSDADYANGDYNGNATYADPSTFCNAANSGHYGYPVLVTGFTHLLMDLGLTTELIHLIV